MARGDPVFTKFDNNIRRSRKVLALLPDERWVYMALNTICVDELQDVLLAANYGVYYVAIEAKINIRIAKRALLHMANVRLIELTDKWSVFVYDVRDRHRKLVWKTRPIWVPNGETLLTHMGPKWVETSEIRDQNKNLSPDSDTEIVTQRSKSEGAPDDGQTARPNPELIPDVKRLLEEQEAIRIAQGYRRGSGG
jgi:hypothetical protein